MNSRETRFPAPLPHKAKLHLLQCKLSEGRCDRASHTCLLLPCRFVYPSPSTTSTTSLQGRRYHPSIIVLSSYLWCWAVFLGFIGSGSLCGGCSVCPHNGRCSIQPHISLCCFRRRCRGRCVVVSSCFCVWVVVLLRRWKVCFRRSSVVFFFYY